MNDDHKRKIKDCYDEIEKIKKWINANPLDSNVKFLVSYAIIKSSGTIEIVFKSILHIFLAEGCKNETQFFLEKKIIDLSCNPNTGNIEKILNEIDTIRKKTFEEQTKGTNEKQDLNSLVQLRNDIAHGRDVSISINSIERYFHSGVIIINILDDIIYGKTKIIDNDLV